MIRLRLPFSVTWSLGVLVLGGGLAGCSSGGESDTEDDSENTESVDAEASTDADSNSDTQPSSDSGETGAGGDGAMGGATEETTVENAGGAGGVLGPPGDPGCGLDAAAFCETFDAPAVNRGRAGELDVAKWSAGRMEPSGPTADGLSLGIGKATIADCRADLPAQVFPGQDALICDPSGDIESNHLLVAVAAQNYGQNSYRIRQPFDFAGRSGKIVFDAEGFVEGGLLGWVSLAVTEDPIAVPSFAVGEGIVNDEGAITPRNGFELQFQNICAGYYEPDVISIRMLEVFQNYENTTLAPPSPTCVSTQRGKLNHFEVNVSTERIEIYATPFSADGTAFEESVLLYGADVALPFTRGYVTISVHNHATLKYSDPLIDAWTARWDNVGFDGPVVSNTREYEVPDAMVLSADESEMNVGYRVADASTGPSDALEFTGVDLADVQAARLLLSSWWPQPYSSGDTPFDQYVLQHRLNGGAWHDRIFSAGELAVLSGGNCQGALGQAIDLDLTELVDGTNSVEFVSAGAGQSYPPLVANIDLILTTE